MPLFQVQKLGKESPRFGREISDERGGKKTNNGVANFVVSSSELWVGFGSS